MKNERGAITILVLTTIVFMIAFLLSTYMIISNRRQAQAEIRKETKEIYEKDLDNVDEIYEDILDKANSIPRLPLEYQEVEYIESTGTQYIDTDFIPNQNSTMELDFIAVGSQGKVYAGCRTGNASTKSFTINTGSTGNKLLYGAMDGSNNKTILSIDDSWYGTRHTVKISKNGFYYDEKLKISPSINDYEADYSVYLFGCNSNGLTLSSNCKIFSCKIYDNNVLERDYIPCYRKSDSVIGMYDMVNDVFYQNEGTGTFLKGEEVLPNIYQEVEYIDSGKNHSYIDTNYYPNQDSGIIISFTANSTTICPFRSSESTVGAYPFGYHMNINWLKNYITYGSKYIYINFNEQPEKIDVYHNKQSVTINEMEFNFSEQTFQSENTLKLGDGSKIIGDVIVLENDIEVRHLFPCYRTSDNVIGMYDIITNEFYTNAGTGNFTKGPNV